MSQASHVEIPLRVLYYGEDRPLPQQLPLRAGPLSLQFEEGDLRYIRFGEREIVRRIYVAVRDRIWRTIPLRLANLRIEARDTSFDIAYDAEHIEGEIDFRWRGKIGGREDGTITFEMDGIARSTFWRSRIGICVLHPMLECAGARMSAEQEGVGTVTGTFPLYIAADAPAVDMKSLAHEVLPGVWARLRFTGDLFEMEDQRNWTDASFKTFCTPLRLPYPVQIEAGTAVRQSITLGLEGQTAVATAARSASIAITMDAGRPRPLPALGAGWPSREEPLTTIEVNRLARLRLSHVRVDLKLSGPEFVSALERSTSAANQLGLRLEAAVFLSAAAQHELASLATEYRRIRPPLAHWLIFHVDEYSTARRWIEMARAALSPLGDQVSFGSGTNHYFTELNRDRPPIELLDRVCYSINPQVHAFDNGSLVEALAAQAATVESARQFIGDRQLAVTPVTLRPRFNQNSGQDPPVPPGQLPFSVDARQMSLFGAAWTLGSIKYLAESGVQSATYYELTGWRGLMQPASGSPLPDRFRSLPGTVFPLYHVLAWVGDFRDGQVVRSKSSDPLQVESLVLVSGQRRRTMLANMTAENKDVNITTQSMQIYRRMLDETNAIHAIQAPEAFQSGPGEMVSAQGGRLEISLRPYAIAVLDEGDKID